KFKSKKNPVQSYTTNNQNGTVNIFENWLKVPKLKELPKTNSSVGIDLGIKDMAILSTGEKIENLKFRKQ
ncbi:transposase, partial [Fusobacterium mortiferum]|nr:transposase [Fusobacterium mortiferum]MBM6876533.1 transposase [Fusobacterium mortiferum]